MEFRIILQALSEMYNGYEAACWLNKSRLIFEGRSAADLMKDNKFPEVFSLLEGESRYKYILSRRKAKV